MSYGVLEHIAAALEQQNVLMAEQTRQSAAHHAEHMANAAETWAVVRAGWEATTRRDNALAAEREALAAGVSAALSGKETSA